MPLGIMVCALKGIEMNSCACFLDPKNILVMVVLLVWPFEDGRFCEWIFLKKLAICQL
jgi:hypothetical protein